MRMKNKNPAVPVVHTNTLSYQQDQQNMRLQVGTAAWYAWLSTTHVFAFRSMFGTFTARKERASNQRGGWYWRAYRRCKGKLHRVYLGKSDEITLDRLNAAAMTLTRQHATHENKHASSQPVLQGQIEASDKRT